MAFKKDYEPVLSAGRHCMSADEFEERFVNDLGGGARAAIWQKFKANIVQKIETYDIRCDIWLNGSFITKCPVPSDIDGSIMVAAEEVERLSEDAIKYLDLFDDSEKPFDSDLDIFLCVVYPKGHALRGDMNDPDGWAKQWSQEHNSGWLKGFVVIPMQVKHGHI